MCQIFCKDFNLEKVSESFGQLEILIMMYYFILHRFCIMVYLTNCFLISSKFKKVSRISRRLNMREIDIST